MAKNNQTDVWRITIHIAYLATTKVTPSFLQDGRNSGYVMRAIFWRDIRHIKRDNEIVQFQTKQKVATFREDNETVMIVYDSGADGS